MAADSPQSEEKSPTLLDQIEQIAKIGATVLVPVVLAVGGWVIQTSIERDKEQAAQILSEQQRAADREKISLEYVKIAKEILTSDKQVPKVLTKWSWQLIDKVSPRPFDPQDLKSLIEGNEKIPVAASPSARPEKTEYDQLFKEMKITEAKIPLIDSMIDRMMQNKDRYAAVTKDTGIPWVLVGFVHLVDSGGNFKTHLHNGDPLTDRTVHFPAGRPVDGNPPFTWEESARDAIEMAGLKNFRDWDLGAILQRLEQYNGFGYRKHNINSPYLWNCSDKYQKGRFVAGGTFDPNAVTINCGAAPIIRRMMDRGLIVLG